MKYSNKIIFDIYNGEYDIKKYNFKHIHRKNKKLIIRPDYEEKYK